jgi:cyanophycinase-like exopeptidase
MGGVIAILGSGETAPTMVKVHRRLIERSGGPAVLLDTPYGFQENADDVSARAQRYFRDSVGCEIDVASWRRATDDDVVRESALARIAAARYVFAGPGSPTYALRVWDGSPLGNTLAGVVGRGGTVVFASAAALTLGVLTVPVYEVYKVGEDPEWRQGLDLVGRLLGLRVAVIPHFDNAEGGTHDTRFCYLGERRLRVLEEQMPAGAVVLGVDEHTGLLIDVDARRAEVVGNGSVTVRRDASSVVHASGKVIDAAELGSLQAAAPTDTAATTDGSPPKQTTVAASVLDEATRLETRFDKAVAARDVDTATGAVLELESAFVAWSADVTQSDEVDRARAVLRRMIVRLGELARAGARDPREVLGPVVEATMAARQVARAEEQWELADLLRDGLLAAGVEVHDEADRSTWTLNG